MTTLRTFIAIDLSAELRGRLGDLQDRLRGDLGGRCVRWVQPQGIHLTLKFLGDTSEKQVADVERALARAAASVAPFAISVGGVGCFPNTRRPRVVWVAVRDKGQMLARLHAAVERHVAPLGWPTDDRGFSPHLTLGRVAKGVSPTVEAAVGLMVESSVVEQIGVQRVTAVNLIASELRPAGAVYTTLVSVPLAEMAPA